MFQVYFILGACFGLMQCLWHCCFTTEPLECIHRPQTQSTHSHTPLWPQVYNIEVFKHDTCGEASLFMTLGEFDIKVGDQSMDVIVPLDLQTEGGGEGQFLWLHCVDVHFLRKDKQSLSCYFMVK